MDVVKFDLKALRRQEKKRHDAFLKLLREFERLSEELSDARLTITEMRQNKGAQIVAFPPRIAAIEQATRLRKLIDEGRCRRQRDVARAIGRSEQYVADMLRILDLPARLLQKLRTSGVDVPADALSKIARLKDAKIQEELVDALLAGETNQQIRDRIANLRDA